MDPYRAFTHLPPSDLSDLDPRFERPRWDEELMYSDLSRAGGTVDLPVFCWSAGRSMAQTVPPAGGRHKKVA